MKPLSHVFQSVKNFCSLQVMSVYVERFYKYIPCLVSSDDTNYTYVATVSLKW